MARHVALESGGGTEPLAVISRRKKQLSSAMEIFINALKEPEPGEKV